MKVLSFPGGVHPQYCKDISIREPLRTAPVPDIAVIPLSQHIGAPNDPVVKKGDEVEEGQLLGTSGSFISAPVHSSVSGKVIDVKKAFHPALGPAMSVFIETDKEKSPKEYTEQDVESLTKEEILEKIKNSGIVGMGGAAFPTYVKLSVPEGKKIKNLVINGAECEPYLTCDHIVMTRRTNDIIKGIDLLAGIIEPENIYLAIEDNKKASIFAFQKALRESSHRRQIKIQTVALETKYPQGGEKQLIKAITGKEVPPGKLPLDIGFLVQNVGTILAIYEAVHFNKPLIERVVTVSGDCLYRPGNFVVRIGSTLKDVMENYEIELYKEPKKIIFGGPMMGFAQPDTDVPILKNTSGILFLSEEAAKDFEEEQCIKCAKCVDVCPVNLVPTEIMKNVQKDRWDAVEDLYVSDCMECGSCSYICPARIPLVQYIKEGKFAVQRKKK